MDARFSYREAAVRGASPVQLVICLYEQAIEDLRRAVIALERGDIENRTRLINHALKVIGQLQGTLDKERGGEVARNLELFYNTIRKGLMEAQLKQSARILEEQLNQLAIVHEAWLEVDVAIGAAPQSEPRESPGEATSDVSNEIPGEADPPPVSPETPSTDWTA
jgi:flagellar secretion chaperone FliS